MSASSKTCTSCQRRLQVERFPLAGKQGRTGTCGPCTNDARRLRSPLPELPRDPVQVRLNNAAALWFHPAQPTNLLRYAA